MGRGGGWIYSVNIIFFSQRKLLKVGIFIGATSLEMVEGPFLKTY